MPRMVKEAGAALEKAIAAGIAKAIKEATGKGPTKSQVKVLDDCVMLKLSGYLFPIEKEMATTHYGFYDVKFNRAKLANANQAALKEVIIKALDRQVTDFFYDVNPLTGLGVMVFYLA